MYIQKWLNKSKEEGYLRMVKGSERPSASEEIGEKFQRPGKSIGRADDEKNRAVKMSAKFTWSGTLLVFSLTLCETTGLCLSSYCKLRESHQRIADVTVTVT